jgi:hypothetical protein
MHSGSSVLRAASWAGTSHTLSGTPRFRCTPGTSTLPSGARTSTSTRAPAASAASSSTTGTRRRFDMPREFVPIRGAQGFQQSNPDVLSVAALLGALQTFHDAGGMTKLRKYSEVLTQRMWDGLVRSPFYVPAGEVARAEDKQRGFTIVTPADSSVRGAQLSLLFSPVGTKSITAHPRTDAPILCWMCDERPIIPSPETLYGGTMWRCVFALSTPTTWPTSSTSGTRKRSSVSLRVLRGRHSCRARPPL